MIASTVISLVVYIIAVLGSPPTARVKHNLLSNQVTFVSLHNQFRAQYGAPAVTWNESRHAKAQAYANKCEFKHSDTQGNYGENLYAETGSSPDASKSDSLNAWMGEASQYDYNNAEFSDAAGHFTQVVWKGTTQIGCAVANCSAGTIFPEEYGTSQFVVCQYTPPGNVEGEFTQNVGQHI